MKINAPDVGALTHASSLYISLRVQKLTKSCVQPNVAGGACFFNEKRVSGVFLIYGEGVHGGRGPTAYACGQFAVAGQESVRD